MSGSRNFRQGAGGVQVSQIQKSFDKVFFVFLVLSLFYRSQMANLKKSYHFSRFQRGSNIFQPGGRGGGDFPEGGLDHLREH